MPTHIYTRLGDWPAVIQGNLRAATAALAFPAGEHGEYTWDEFPHAIEYLEYAYLQQGADDKAMMQLDTPARDAASGADVQDGVPPRVDAGAVRARTA